MSPDNGPASRKLAAAIRAHLLTRQPYKGYGVTQRQVFASGSFRIHEDLYLLSDHVFGWKSNYAIERKAGIEAVKAHPGTYTSGVLHTIWHQLSRSYFRAPSSGGTAPSTPAPTVERRGRRLPAPTEGEPIPGGQVVWISRPDNAIRQVWTSPTQYHFAFRTPKQHRQFDAILNRVDSLTRNLPDRKGNAQLSLRLDQLSRWFPRSFIWILVGAIALVLRRPRGVAALLAVPLASLFVVVFNALGLFADPRFALPVAPGFVFFGACALVGRR